MGLANIVQSFLSPNQLQVISDFGPAFLPLPDGTPDNTRFTLNGNPLSVTFFDKVWAFSHGLGFAASEALLIR